MNLKAIKWRLFNKVCCVLTYINPVWHIKLRYLAYYKKAFPDKKPKTFVDKLIWLRIHYYNNSKFVEACADKLKVRDYVKAVGCGKYLNDLHGVYDSVNDVPWDSLPEQFAIKWNFGSGYNIICKDKKQLDIHQVKESMRVWGEQKYWVPNAEMQYKNCPQKILVEKYLGDAEGALPYDYKLYCFNGKCRAIMYVTGRENVIEREKCFFSPEWDYLGQVRAGFPDPTEPIPAPKTLTEMIACAEKLSKNIPFVRIDLFEYDNRIYFGEMTFTPTSGFNVPSIPIENRDMGEYIDLSDEELDKFMQLEEDTKIWSAPDFN